MIPAVNIANLDMREIAHGENFASSIGRVGGFLNTCDLGCQYFIVPPNMRAFPFHNHHNCDEIFIILEGDGEYRYGEAVRAIKKGDILGAPKGDKSTAHQIINTGSKPLKYLAVSTKPNADVVEYPDSGKFAAFGGEPKQGEGMLSMPFYRMIIDGVSVDYWDGE
jgi:uncharacterized cupin superfamily protein